MSVQLPMGINERLTRHRLARCVATLRELREDLRVTREHFTVISEEASDTELRALVSETPSAEAEHRENQGHLIAIGRHLRHLEERIAECELEQDLLLDRLSGKKF
jgi:hypothetical protein